MLIRSFKSSQHLEPLPDKRRKNLYKLRTNQYLEYFGASTDSPYNIMDKGN